MNYSDGASQLKMLRQRIAETRRDMQALQATIEPEVVEDYIFTDLRGPLRLSELFRGKQDLFVIHNMGTTCPYCTLWADGYNGVYEHLADRAAFVVSSPDVPEIQQRFARSRAWKFAMVSHAGTSFAQDMGYRASKGGWLPGVSVFQQKAGRIFRVADSGFEPGDDFCALWHFFELLPQGAMEWQPRLDYSKS